MRGLISPWLLVLLVAGRAYAADPPPRPFLASHTFPFSFRGGLSGPGAVHLKQALVGTEFVLIGEGHHDHDTPLFSEALYDALHASFGFDHLVVEQDPVGVEMALEPGRRGRPAAIAQGLASHPNLLGFASDQDLELLAHVGAVTPGSDAVWGLEQAQAPARYLEELVPLAPTSTAHAAASTLLARARAEERSRSDIGKFLAFDPATLSDLEHLQVLYGSEPGERADHLLRGLVASARIYALYVRARTEHAPSLGYANGVAREDWLKQGFLAHYRAALASTGAPPHALFKFGGNHMTRGLGTTGAWTLGGLVHDLAALNGETAYGVCVFAVGGSTPDWAQAPDLLRPLLPDARPIGPVLIDLQALRPQAQAYVDQASAESRTALHDLIFGYEALVVLPDSQAASWRLTGFAAP